MMVCITLGIWQPLQLNCDKELSYKISTYASNYILKREVTVTFPLKSIFSNFHINLQEVRNSIDNIYIVGP